jgi:multiple sugar transport system permease protein
MWRNVNFGLYLRNSLIICGFTMLFAMIFSTLAAYALSRFRFPGADLFSNAILATQMIPAIMYLIPIYIMFVKFTVMSGIPVKGTFPGIILIYSAFFIPFSIWILRGFFASIPRELEEAALIDGCGRFRTFWYVALPLAMPGIIATGIYIFLTAWDELMFAWVLTNADTMTIPVGIRLFVGNYQNRFDLMMAAATVATLPVVVLFFMLQRHIVRGLTAGAVKG